VRPVRSISYEPTDAFGKFDLGDAPVEDGHQMSFTNEMLNEGEAVELGTPHYQYFHGFSLGVIDLSVKDRSPLAEKVRPSRDGRRHRGGAKISRHRFGFRADVIGG